MGPIKIAAYSLRGILSGEVKRASYYGGAEHSPTTKKVSHLMYVAVSTPGSRNYEKRSQDQDHHSHSSITWLVGCRTATMTLSDAIVFYFLLGLRHWEILIFLKSEEGYEYVNIAQTSEVIGTVQEKSPVGRYFRKERNWQIRSLRFNRLSLRHQRHL